MILCYPSQPARVKSRFIANHVVEFIDDHVDGADKPGGVADRRDCEQQR
jgi:hypothetical protein